MSPISCEERDRIEMETRGQRENPLWHEERENRIPASSFASICKSRHRETTAIAIQKAQTRYIREYEKQMKAAAFKLYKKQTGNIVKHCGLFVALDRS